MFSFSAKNKLKMAIVEPIFGHQETPLPPFREPIEEKLLFDTAIDMENRWSDFEAVLQKTWNFTWGLLAWTCSPHTALTPAGPCIFSVIHTKQHIDSQPKGIETQWLRVRDAVDG